MTDYAIYVILLSILSMLFVNIILCFLLFRAWKNNDSIRNEMLARYSDIMDRFMEKDVHRLKQAQKIERKTVAPDEEEEGWKPEEAEEDEYEIDENGNQIPKFMGSNL